jgi:hypothetical protein
MFRTNQLNLHKRAFDRLESSPFDFGTYAKRFSDDDAFNFGLKRKRSFDRLDAGPFNFGLKRKRSFDRLENSPFDQNFGFGLQKRSVGEFLCHCERFAKFLQKND